MPSLSPWVQNPSNKTSPTFSRSFSGKGFSVNTNGFFSWRCLPVFYRKILISIVIINLLKPKAFQLECEKNLFPTFLLFFVSLTKCHYFQLKNKQIKPLPPPALFLPWCPGGVNSLALSPLRIPGGITASPLLLCSFLPTLGSKTCPQQNSHHQRDLNMCLRDRHVPKAFCFIGNDFRRCFHGLMLRSLGEVKVFKGCW